MIRLTLRKIILFSVALLNLSVFCQSLKAEEGDVANTEVVADENIIEEKLEKKEDPYKEMPQSGVLSGTYSLGRESKAVAAPWGKQSSAAVINSPLTGSVSKVSSKQWKASLFNNSKDSFSASIKVRQIDQRGNTVKTDNFSMSLKAGASDERLVSAASSAHSAELELVSWKKL